MSVLVPTDLDAALQALDSEPDALVLAGGTDAMVAVNAGRLRFESVVAYRRALSPFPVREHVVPLLSEALADEPATYEVLVDAAGGAATERASLRAEP